MKSGSQASAWLKKEFDRRKAKNPRYSVRAFSRKLSLSPGALSEIFQNKRRLTLKLGRLIPQRLELSPARRRYFLTLLEQENSFHEAQARLMGLNENVPDFRPLSEEVFHLIADPNHYALMELTHTTDFRYDIAWIAKRIGVSVKTAQTLLLRLLQLDLLKEENGTLIQAQNVTTSHDIPSKALRASHKRSLKQTADAMGKIPLALRDISSITMPIDSSRLHLAKQAIAGFRRQMTQLLETGETDEVYHLHIQLVPATVLREKT